MGERKKCPRTVGFLLTSDCGPIKQETAAILKSHFEEAINTDEGTEVYELMSAASEDIMMKYSGCSEDIYESMLGIDPECAEDLCKIRSIRFDLFARERRFSPSSPPLSFLDEVMSEVNDNPEEAMLRKFFQGIRK